MKCPKKIGLNTGITGQGGAFLAGFLLAKEWNQTRCVHNIAKKNQKTATVYNCKEYYS